MLIRKASKKDVEAIKQIKPSIDEKTILDRLKYQENGLSDFLVLEDSGTLVSFVVLKWHGKRTHPEYPDMEDLYTREDKRGLGFATAIIKECERRVKEKGYSKIGLAVNPELNPKAKILYQRLGYKHEGQKSYLDGVYNNIEDWVIDLEKDLD